MNRSATSSSERMSVPLYCDKKWQRYEHKFAEFIESFELFLFIVLMFFNFYTEIILCFNFFSNLIANFSICIFVSTSWNFAEDIL